MLWFWRLKPLTTRWWQSSSLSSSLSPCLSSGNLSEGCSSLPEGNRNRAKSTAKLLGPLSCSAWAGRTGEHKHRTFPSWRQSLMAATGSLEENMLPLLRYWLSSRVNKVLILGKFRAATSHFFYVKWKFRWNWREVVVDQSSAHRFALPFYQSLVSE